MKKINVIQFTPHFPPYKWWLEAVADEMGEHWVKQNYWKVINVTSSVWQEEGVFEYERLWCRVLVIPAFHIVPNFPIPKFWKKEYWSVFTKIKNIIWTEKEDFRIITHTRFFLSSFIWWLFAIKNKIPWVHLEHGSGYVKLSSKFKSKVAYIYDRLIWKWIFKSAQKILVISGACKKFVHEKFVDREVEVFYRGLDFPESSDAKKGDIKIVFVGRLVWLKWVTHLIEAYKKLDIKNDLIIIWDGEEKESLEKQAWGCKGISFLWFQNRDFVLDYLKKNNCLFINPSYQEGMPTSVMEALFYKNVVVATDVWWTSEISEEEDLFLVQPWNVDELSENLKIALEKYKGIAGRSKTTITERFSRKSNVAKLYELIK
jgi:glycosyltransferase involved in cell wall biosynthesis